MSQTIDQVFRDYKTQGVPASGEHEPDKREIRALLKMIQNSGGQAVTRNTLSALNGVTPPTENYMGVVLADPTASNNGYYYRSGGAWVFGRPFPDTFAEVALSGSGTAQTGAVDTGVNPSGVEVFFARVTTPNTGPLTLSISGGPAREVVNLAGNPLSAGEWTGMVMFYLNEDGDYQLLIDAGAAAAAAQSATNAAASAAAAAAFGTVNFDLVADLLADDNDVIGYVGSGASVEVAAGFHLTAQGFRYEVAASDATDAHVQTAGGVKLRVLPTADGCINAEAAGVDISGVADSTDAIIIAASVANELDIPLVARGLIRLHGSSNITITTDADFSGAVFICETWSGRFIFGRSQPEVEYTSGPVVNGILSSADLRKSSSVFSGWSGVDEVNDSYVIIETDQDFYRFRGSLVKRLELNRVTKDGVLEAPLRYSLEGVGITKVRVFKMENRWRYVRGLTLDTRGNDITNFFITVSTSLLDFDVRFIQDTAPSVNTNPQYVDFHTCCSVVGRVVMQWVNRTSSQAGGGYSGWTYSISMQDSFDVDITPHSDGDGWGATSSSASRRVTFRNGTLSRVDFHHPFVDWLRLRDMVVTDHGVLVTALGDLDMDTVTFINRTPLNLNASFVIASRPDSGGFADGNLIARNVSVISDYGTGSFLEFIRHQNDSTGTDKPAGSPINYQWWNSIDIDGIKYVGGHDGQQLNIQPLNVQPQPNCPMASASKVNIRGVTGNVVMSFLTYQGTTPAKPTDTPFNISVRDSAVKTISFVGGVGGVTGRALAALIEGCSGFGDVDGVHLDLVAEGKYTVQGGVVNRFDFYSGAGITNQPVNVVAKGSKIVNLSGTAIIDDLTGLDNFNVILEDCEFVVSSAGRLTPILSALVIRPTFVIDGVRSKGILVSNVIEGEGTFTFGRAPVVGQELWLDSGIGTERAYVPFTIPPVGGRAIIPGLQAVGGTAAAFGVLHRSTGTGLVASGSVTFRQVLLGVGVS